METEDNYGQTALIIAALYDNPDIPFKLRKSDALEIYNNRKLNTHSKQVIIAEGFKHPSEGFSKLIELGAKFDVTTDVD